MTQNEMVLAHLQTFGSITPLQAMNNYGCMRLGARINELRKSGYNIRTNRVRRKNRYGKMTRYALYRMVSDG